MADSTSSWESTSVAAVLARRGREDVAELVGDLAAMLSAIVPGARVKRTLLRRQIASVRLPLGGNVYTLERRPDGGYATLRQQEVRGVVIRTDPLEVDAFLSELGAAIDAEVQRNERMRTALRSWLDTTSL